MLLREKFQSLKNDDSGAIAIWATITLPLLLGAAALSVDASRFYNLDQDLQSAADAFSKAGAAELDQRGDSLIRANRAITTLVNNEQKFATRGRGNVKVGSIRFLKSIPEKDYEDISSDQITTDPSQARYVEVEVVPERISTLFPQGVVRTITSIELKAVSTSGFSQDICGVAPVFICNPFEDISTTSIYEAMNDPSFRRRQILFKSQGPNAQYGSGNFGYLDPFEGNSGASKIADAIAVDSPNLCLSKSSGVNLRSGNINRISQAFNVRFDIYEGSFKKVKTNPAYAPAANVIKGFAPKKKNACDLVPNPAALGMPRDDTYESSSSSSSQVGSLGSGNWNFVEYMRINHNYMRSLTIEGVTYTLDYVNGRSSPSAPPSRYALYRWEIDNDSIPGSLTYGNSAVTPEEGIPQCHSTGAHPDPDIDRRIFTVAVLNCENIEASGGMNGRSDGLPVETFVKVFMTEPMGSGNENALYGEIVGPVIQGQDIPARDKVMVVR
jgi:hypothetical protein